MDAAVPVSGMALLENIRDRGLEVGFRVRGKNPCLVVEECRPGQPGDVQKNFQPVFGLESDDSADL
jgi:hypothetical protein